MCQWIWLVKGKKTFGLQFYIKVHQIIAHMKVSFKIGKRPEWHIQKKYITNEDNNIIRVRSTSIILLIFMSDIFFLYMSNEGCFTFIIHHFVRFMGQIIWIVYEKTWNRLSKSMSNTEYKTSIFTLQYLSHFCMDFYATYISRSATITPF